MTDDKCFEIAGRTIAKQGQRIAELEAQLVVAQGSVLAANCRIEALAIELAALRKVAERARWCEERRADVDYTIDGEWCCSYYCDGAEAVTYRFYGASRDTAIDRAMQEGK